MDARSNRGREYGAQCAGEYVLLLLHIIRILGSEFRKFCIFFLANSHHQRRKSSQLQAVASKVWQSCCVGSQRGFSCSCPERLLENVPHTVPHTQSASTRSSSEIVVMIQQQPAPAADTKSQQLHVFLQGLPFAIAGVGDLLALFRCVSCRYRFSTDVTRPAVMGAIGRVYSSCEVSATVVVSLLGG